MHSALGAGGMGEVYKARKMASVPVRRIGRVPGVRAAVSRRRFRTMADFFGWRHASSMGAERTRAVLHRHPLTTSMPCRFKLEPASRTAARFQSSTSLTDHRRCIGTTTSLRTDRSRRNQGTAADEDGGAVCRHARLVRRAETPRAHKIAVRGFKGSRGRGLNAVVSPHRRVRSAIRCGTESPTGSCRSATPFLAH